MDAKFQKPDVITENPIADRPVCPYIVDCGHFDTCNQPDLNYLRYIVEFCGNQFVQCRHYRAHLTGPGKSSEPADQTAHGPRAGPT
jgi:hypothetical protein